MINKIELILTPTIYTTKNALKLLGFYHTFLHQVPAASGQKGIEISNRLEELGKSVIGWDMEWPVNWNTNRLKTGGAAMYGTMNSRHTKVIKKNEQSYLLTYYHLYISINSSKF